MRNPLSFLSVAGLLLATSACNGSSPAAPSTPPAPVPATYGVSGVVTESAPTRQVVIAGATVEILSGPQQGQKVVSAADGAFSLTGLTAAADAIVKAAGYEDGHLHLASDSSGRTDIGLVPAFKMLTRTVGTDLGPRQDPTSFFVDVHHGGLITISHLYFYFSSDPNNPPTRTVEIWDGTHMVASASTNRQAWFEEALIARVEAGARYEIRILGGQWTAVTMEWPN